MDIKKAFTLAEALVTLAIIGVVAALVIPSVLKNYSDRKYNTARLKALKTFGEAGKMASINEEMNSQTNAKDFVNNVLSKYLKITKVCDNAHPNDCGFPSEIQPSNPSDEKINIANITKWRQLITDFYGPYTVTLSPVDNSAMSTLITTTDGFSALLYYNPKCGRTSRAIAADASCAYKECGYYIIDAICMNVIYDMNGVKGPNHVGEDIGFVTTFWSGLNAVSSAPGIIPYSVNATGRKTAWFKDASNVCSGKSTRQTPYTLPNIYELSSLYTNKILSSMQNLGIIWSGSVDAERPGYTWRVMGAYYNTSSPESQSVERSVYCVRR